MFDREFLGSKVGAAALVSIAAMVAFNIFALYCQPQAQVATQVLAGPLHPVELA